MMRRIKDEIERVREFASSCKRVLSSAGKWNFTRASLGCFELFVGIVWDKNGTCMCIGSKQKQNELSISALFALDDNLSTIIMGAKLLSGR